MDKTQTKILPKFLAYQFEIMKRNYNQSGANLMLVLVTKGFPYPADNLAAGPLQ
jgi:hypothetical protein